MGGGGNELDEELLKSSLYSDLYDKFKITGKFAG